MNINHWLNEGIQMYIIMNSKGNPCVCGNTQDPEGNCDGSHAAACSE